MTRGSRENFPVEAAFEQDLKKWFIIDGGAVGRLFLEWGSYHWACVLMWIESPSPPDAQPQNPGIPTWFIFSTHSKHPLWASLDWIFPKIYSDSTHIVSLFTLGAMVHCAVFYLDYRNGVQPASSPDAHPSIRHSAHNVGSVSSS